MKYTKELETRLVELYRSGVVVEDIAKELDTTTRSVIAKLSSLGVYQKKQYLDKRGNPPQSKGELVDQIADLLGTQPDRVESLEKANKSVLLLLIEHLK
jgi:transcriptional regulator